MNKINVNVFKPPQAIPKIEGNKVFLAGSIEMGTADNWQDRVTASILENSPKCYIFNPRRNSWDASWEQSIKNDEFYTQVNWEHYGLYAADFIFMHFVPNTKSPITLLELGLMADSGKLIVSCPDGFWRKGNVEYICQQYQIPLLDSLELGLNFLIRKLKDKENGRYFNGKSCSFN